MPHVGIQGFRPGGAEKHRAEHQKAGEAVAEQIAEAVERIERDQNPRMGDDAGQSERADGHEPQRHDRPEQLADAVAALPLQGEQADQDQRRQRDDIGRDPWHRGLEAFERAQHRDRRRNGAVAVQQRGAEHAERDHHRPFAMLDAQKRHQRQDAAFAFVVGAHHHRDVFDRGGDHQRPDDQRQHSDRRLRRGAAGPLERGLERIEGAGADIAIDHAQRAEHEGAQRPVRRGRSTLGEAGRCRHGLLICT